MGLNDGLNENPFWIGLYTLIREEMSKHKDSSVPLTEQSMAVLEAVAQKVFQSGDFYLVRGFENPDPLPADGPLNFFIVGAWLGNYLAWRSGVKFMDRVTPNQ
jgi:hypothetical protein